MAAVIVDKQRFGMFGQGIPAAAEFGEVLRNRVVSGLHVLKQVSNISKQAYFETRNDVDASRRILRSEYFTCKRRNVLFHSMPLEAVADYRLMFRLVLMSFISQSPPTIPLRPENWNADICELKRPLDFGHRGSLWDWFLYHEGPGLLWRQWCPKDQLSSSQTIIRERIIEEFENIDERRKNVILQSAWNHRRLILSFPLLEDKQFAPKKAHNPGPYLYQYTKIRRDRLSRGIEDPPETLEEVPFFTDLRTRPIENVYALRYTF
jgi:hypothetical protein